MDEKKQWKNKINQIMQVCQDELKRTTEIGRKMLSASKTNTELHESYEDLGRYIAESLESGKLQLEDPKVQEYLEKINQCQNDLEELEGEVNKIRFSAGPIDISKEKSNSNKQDH